MKFKFLLGSRALCLSLLALCGTICTSIAQSQTFQVNLLVDMTTYIDTCSRPAPKIAPNGMRVGGTFSDMGATSLGGTAIPNWTPGDTNCAMTYAGNNVWRISLRFPNPTLNDTLQFKFVNGTWSPQGDNEGLDALNSLQGCRAGGFGNRAFVIQPGTFRYCYDRCDSVCLRIQTGLEEPFWAEAVTYPNPARSIAYTQLYLSNNKAVHAFIVDASGRMITTLHQGIMDAGQQILQWDGTDVNGTPVASGVYTLRLDMEEKVLYRKILWQP